MKKKLTQRDIKAKTPPQAITLAEWLQREEPPHKFAGKTERDYRLWKMKREWWNEANSGRDRFITPKHDERIEDYLGEHVSAQASWQAENLLVLAKKGDKKALETVARLAIQLTEFTNGSFDRKATLQRFAKKQLWWPVLETPFKGLANTKPGLPSITGKKLLDGFSLLGENAAALKEATRGKGPTARKWALSLLLEIESVRQNPVTSADEWLEGFTDRTVPKWKFEASNLERVSEDSALRWIKVCHSLFKEWTPGGPEKIPELADLGRRKAGVRTNRKGEAPPSDQRAEIWQSIRESIQTCLHVHRKQT